MLKKLGLLSFVVFGLASQGAMALELDWSGQFRTEFNYLKSYTLDGTATGLDNARLSANGYYIPYGGSNDAQYQTLFMKLQPKLIVNDNISVKSEWWLGDPVFGFYGSASPYSTDQKWFNSNSSRGSSITAQRFWAEILTDFGTLKVGRAPLNYGLGLVWNSGDDLWSHYESTGDVVSLVSKFGAFSFIPSIVSYSTGNSVGGNVAWTSGSSFQSLPGSGGVSDYSIQLKYENLDEDFTAGLNFIRRIAGAAQDPNSGYQWNGGYVGMNYNTYDIYLAKKLGKLSLAAEIPVVTGNIAGIPYSTWAFAADADLRVNEPWEFDLKLGRAPGQPSSSTQQPGSVKSFYFNPDYKLGMIMFNYALHHFGGPNNSNDGVHATGAALQSPYDNPITDANYLVFSPVLHADKWKFHARYVFASAPDTAQANQSFFWNNWTRSMQANNTGSDQSSWLGWEMDYGADFQYDQYFVFGAEIGWWLPGQFYAFSNSGTANSTNSVMATALRVGVNF